MEKEPDSPMLQAPENHPLPQEESVHEEPSRRMKEEESAAAFYASAPQKPASEQPAAENAAAPDGALTLLVHDTSTNAMAQLLVSGSFPVVIDANIANVSILNKSNVTVKSGSTLSTLEISGDNSSGSTLTVEENAAITDNVKLYTKTTLTNSGELGEVSVGKTSNGADNYRNST